MKRLTALLAALLAAGAAQAGVVTYGSLHIGDYHKTEVNLTDTLHFFDASLGRLTGVSFTFDGGLKTSIDLTNNSTVKSTLIGDSTSQMLFTSSFSALNSLLTASDPLLTLKVRLTKEVEAGQTSSGNQKSITDKVNWSPAALASYYSAFTRGANDTFTVSCTSLTGLSASGGGGNVTAKQSTDGYCGASVSYFYDSNNVPEPASLALVGLAAGAAGLSRRRRTLA